YEDTKFLPLSFSWEGRHLICSGGEFDGYTVVMIGGVPVSRLYEQFREMFSYELDAWARHAFASRIIRSDYLAFAGIDIGKDIDVTLMRQNDGSLVNKAFALQENDIAMPVE